MREDSAPSKAKRGGSFDELGAGAPSGILGKPPGAAGKALEARRGETNGFIVGLDAKHDITDFRPKAKMPSSSILLLNPPSRYHHFYLK